MRNEKLENKIIELETDYSFLPEAEKDALSYDAIFIKEAFDKNYLAIALAMILTKNNEF